MFVDGMIRKSVDSIPWQDYRSSNTGMIVTYKTDPVSELAIREVPEEVPSEVVFDPHYETRTYGLYGCDKSKLRSSFVKAKCRYLFFLAKYEGTREEFRERFFVTGCYRIKKTADVLKLHLRYLPNSSCMDEEKCVALLADEAIFVPLENAFEITDKILLSWNYKARISRQTRIMLNEEQMRPILEVLRAAPNAIDAYIAETRRLLPYDDESKIPEEDLGEEVSKELLEETDEAVEESVAPVGNDETNPSVTSASPGLQSEQPGTQESAVDE